MRIVKTGGWNVRTRVVVTHIPTGIQSAASDDRRIHHNQKLAMNVLRSKLRCGPPPTHRVRSYILDLDYVKDGRTGKRTEGKTAEILDGKIDGLIAESIRADAIADALKIEAAKVRET